MGSDRHHLADLGIVVPAHRREPGVVLPGVVAFGRVVLGVAALALFRTARKAIDREDRARIVFVGIVGIGMPAYMFALAEQTVDSAVAGMLVSGVPIISTTIFAVVSRTIPGARQLMGLAIGFVGIFLLALPELTGADATPIGVMFVFFAMVGYASSNNVYVPIGRKYGGMTVQLWAQLAALVVLFPISLGGWASSTFTLRSGVALVALGVLGTGIARAAHVSLVTRVGPSRGTIAAYLIPVVAMVLGVALLGDEVAPVQVAGVGLALGGGFLISRGT